MNNNTNHVKILFKLNRDEDGYPPVDVEGIWALKLENGFYQVDNSPFYVTSLSLNDIVSAELVNDHLMFSAIISRSKHSTLRVIMFEKARMQQVRDELTSIGCTSERSNVNGFFAVNVPPEVKYSAVLARINPYLESRLLDYEESAIRHSDDEIN